MAGVVFLDSSVLFNLLDVPAKNGLGSGDASLLLEMDRYREKVPSATPVSLWPLDETLGSFG